MYKFLQKLGKSLMLPVAALPICGILMGLGYALGLYLLHLGEVASMLTALLGLAAGFVPAFLLNRSIARSAAPEFAILKQLR